MSGMIGHDSLPSRSSPWGRGRKQRKRAPHGCGALL